jgi:2-polyprenyl-3-methyl-5-hydroxy-6-metoxy-1,4-benzoquinol methylase
MGAGTGAFLATMQRGGWETTGIEPDKDARALAKKTFGVALEDATFFETLSTANFDAITLWHVLEHVHQLHEYVEGLKKALTPKGKLFIAVPNYTAGDADIYGMYWAAYDVPRHLYHFTPKSIYILMQQHGLKVTHKKPMWLDAFYISLLSSKYHKGKPNLIGAGFNGLRSNVSALMNKERCSSLIYIIEKT